MIFCPTSFSTRLTREPVTKQQFEFPHFRKIEIDHCKLIYHSLLQYIIKIAKVIPLVKYNISFLLFLLTYQQFNFLTLPSEVARDLDKTTSSVSAHIVIGSCYIRNLFAKKITGVMDSRQQQAYSF